MARHFLFSANACTLSLKAIFRMSGDEAHMRFGAGHRRAGQAALRAPEAGAGQTFNIALAGVRQRTYPGPAANAARFGEPVLAPCPGANRSQPMPTYTVTDGQTQSFSFGAGFPNETAVINASGSSRISIAVNQGRNDSPRPVDAVLNLAPGAQVDASFSGVGVNTITVNGDATTTLIVNGTNNLSGTGDRGGAVRLVIKPKVVGTGTFNLSNSSSLEFGGSVASGVTVNFGPSNLYSATLKLDNPSAFKGAVNFNQGNIILGGLSQATDYDFTNNVLTIYGGPGDAALAALRFTDNSPEKAGLALRLVEGAVQVSEQGSYGTRTDSFLAGTALTQHMAPPPPAITQPATTTQPTTTQPATTTGNQTTQPTTTQPVTPPPPPTTTQPSVNPPVLISDGTTGQPVTTIAAQPYAGPVAGIAQQVVAVSPQSLNILATVPNLFIRTGSGTDAIQALGGTNVLDGGTGSNFLTAGAGADTFFVDARGAAADTWSTVAKFGAGDAATLWGVSAATPQQWADGQGAAGATGLTLHAGAAAGPTASITLAGFTTADLAGGKVTASFGRDAASGSDYLYLRAT